MGLPARKDGAYRYRDLLAWPENERWELVEGIAYDTTPAPSLRHQRVLRNLFRQVDAFL